LTAAAVGAAVATPRGHVEVQRSLLHSDSHGGLAVWVWAMYETLMRHGLGGGRAPAVARRRFLAERAGTSTTAHDGLLASAPGGPYLSRPAGAAWLNTPDSYETSPVLDPDVHRRVVQHLP
jgi:hypothetical protein